VADGGTAGGEVLLAPRGPLAVEPLRRFVAGHAVPGLERHDAATGEHTRALPDGRGGQAVVTVRLARGADGAPRVTARSPGGGDGWVPAVRRWLALDADAAAADAALAEDPLLAPLVAARPGLRVPGAVDGAETAVLAVLGQQVSLGAARTFAGRLVAAFGEPAAGGLHRFPAPAALAAAGPEAVQRATGLTGARSRTVHALASALADAAVDLSPGQPPEARALARARLLALPGIGPWTADYVALRALGDPDAFLGDDLVLKRALGVGRASEAVARAEAWRPWRGHALLHLWTREVFA
jgi:3-methyladenine DNA glycosylase/8-oxoguanine DNA glycosylase